MSSPASDHEATRRLAAMRRALVTGGQSPRHADRLITELADHHASIRAELAEMGIGGEDATRIAERRIGPLDEIVRRALADRRRFSLGRRHPTLLFVIAPPLGMLASIVVATVLFAAPMALAGALGVDLTGAWMAAIPGVFLAMVPLLAATLAALVTRYALSRNCRIVWPLASIALLAILCGLLRWQLTPPEGPAPGVVSFGLSVPMHHWLWAIPPAVFIMIVLHHRRANARPA